jgi:hypothetical protein
VTYVVEEITIVYAHNPDPTYGFNDGYFESSSRQDYRPPAGPKSVPIVAFEGISNTTSQAGSDTMQNAASDHAKASEANVGDQSGRSDATVNRTANVSTNQSSYTAAPWTAHTASLMPGRAGAQLLELMLGKQFLMLKGAKSADGAQTEDSAAVQLVRAGISGLAGAEMFIDFIHGGLPLLAEMPMNPSVQQALDTVMADIKLIGTEVSEFLGGVRFTPMVLAVTAATAGAGAAAYLRRRNGREARDRDDEVSSSWLFARLQPIPLES